MRNRPSTVLALLIAILFASCALPADASFCSSRLFSVSPTNPLLSEHEPWDGFLLSEVPMFLPGEIVLSGHGLAANWNTETLYVLLDVAGIPGSYLGTVDPDSAVVTPIGATGMSFESLAVGPGGTLFAVTGETGPDPETLFNLDPVSGAPAIFCSLGGSDTGEAIVASAFEDVLYHVSGSAGPYDPLTDTGVLYETVSLGGPVVCATTPITPDTILTSQACAAITVLADGLLSWKPAGGAGPIYVVDPFNGELVSIGFTPVEIAGLAALPVCSTNFYLRGDANNDLAVNIADAITVLNSLFLAPVPIPCDAAMDVNDDDVVNIADPIYLLGYLFTPGAPGPPPPFPDCSFDPFPGGQLTCNGFICP